MVGSTLYFTAYDAGGQQQLWLYSGSGGPTQVTGPGPRTAPTRRT